MKSNTNQSIKDMLTTSLSTMIQTITLYILIPTLTKKLKLNTGCPSNETIWGCNSVAIYISKSMIGQ